MAGAFFVCIFLLGLGALSSAVDDLHSFIVAHVKPHYGCRDIEGQHRVRNYINNLTDSGVGLIALLEMEFQLERPHGYTAFGGNCKARHSDAAVVLVDERIFSVISGVGQTIMDNYSAMPFVANGLEPDVGPMCVADPQGLTGDGSSIGERPYAGAVLQHKPTGKEICVLASTFPHCYGNWSAQFISDVKFGCGDRQLIVVADTNAGCENLEPGTSLQWSVSSIAESHGTSWGFCHDPGLHADATCCNDTKRWNTSRPLIYGDRIATCRGGLVDDFAVASHYLCNASEEHRFITARVHLAQEESRFCLDHMNCAKQWHPYLDALGGRCCPPSDGAHLECCDNAPGDFIL